MEEITYEGYGPAGAAIIIEAATDNRNRTVGEVRNVLTRGGGSLGETNSVMWNFETRGVINVPANGKDPDEIAMTAIDAGAEDFSVGDGAVEIYTQPSDLEAVKKTLEGNGIAIDSAEVNRVPKTTISLDTKDGVSLLRIVERLEALDDVQKVYFNADLSDEVMAAYAS
jgi:YebC/PmpR family DNA-binding regulatory protein